MDDQMLTAIAATLTTKAIKGATESARAACLALANVVQRKLALVGGTPDALEAARADPSEMRLRDLRTTLSTAIADDPAFAAEVRRLWGQTTHRGEGAEATINTLSGEVGGNVVQARDVEGEISFGA